jgi:hypothetical protein
MSRNRAQNTFTHNGEKCCNMKPNMASTVNGFAQREGAKRLLRECVALVPDDIVAIVFDESSEAVAQIICAAAADIGVVARPLKKAYQEQLSFQSQEGLSNDVLKLFSNARAILTCVQGDPATTKFRRELVRQAVRNNTRVGHMPGVSLEILEAAHRVNFDDVEKRCGELALALALGHKARLQTSAMLPDGKTRACVLEMDIGGLERSSVVSSGRIPLGRWGNIPGGETFIAPLESGANGEFCLNGAFSGRVLKDSEAIILSFCDSRLDAIEGPHSVTSAFENLFRLARDSGDSNWNVLAELGIGVNEGVRLTGISLYDEKCLGTIHIALGDNSTFGGRNESDVHEDLVSIDPTLEVDGKTILLGGKYSVRKEDWEDCLEDVSVCDAAFPADARVRRSVIKGRTRDSSLIVEVGISDGRMSSYVLGDAATTQILARVYSVIPAGGFDLELAELRRKSRAKWPDLQAEKVGRALVLLQKHRLVSINGQGRH